MPDQNNEPREDDLENAEDSLSNFGIADQSKENIAQLGKSLKGAGKNTLKTFGNLAKKTGTGAIKAADTLTKSPSQIKKFIAESSLPIGDDWQIYNKAKTQGFNKKKLEIDWKAYTRQKDGKDEVAFSMPRALFSDNAINKIDQYLAKLEKGELAALEGKSSKIADALDLESQRLNALGALHKEFKPLGGGFEIREERDSHRKELIIKVPLADTYEEFEKRVEKTLQSIGINDSQSVEEATKRLWKPPVVQFTKGQGEPFKLETSDDRPVNSFGLTTDDRYGSENPNRTKSVGVETDNNGQKPQISVINNNHYTNNYYQVNNTQSHHYDNPQSGAKTENVSREDEFENEIIDAPSPKSENTKEAYHFAIHPQPEAEEVLTAEALNQDSELDDEGVENDFIIPESQQSEESKTASKLQNQFRGQQLEDDNPEYFELKSEFGEKVKYANIVTSLNTDEGYESDNEQSDKDSNDLVIDDQHLRLNEAGDQKDRASDEIKVQDHAISLKNKMPNIASTQSMQQNEISLDSDESSLINTENLAKIGLEKNLRSLLDKLPKGHHQEYAKDIRGLLNWIDESRQDLNFKIEPRNDLINNKEQKASVKDIARSFSQTESKESSVNTDFLKNLEDLKSEVGSQEQDLKGSVADIVSDIKENAAKVGALRDFFGIDQQEKSNDKNAKYKPPVNDLSSLDNNKELFSDLANSVGNKILECEKYDTNRPNLANNISISTGSKPER